MNGKSSSFPQLHYHGNWTISTTVPGGSASALITTLIASTKGSTISVKYTGSSIKVLGTIWPTGKYGPAISTFILDGTSSTTFTSPITDSALCSFPLYAASDLLFSPHELNITVDSDESLFSLELFQYESSRNNHTISFTWVPPPLHSQSSISAQFVEEYQGVTGSSAEVLEARQLTRKASEPMLLGGPVSSTMWSTHIFFGSGSTSIDSFNPILPLPSSSTPTPMPTSDYTTSSSTMTQPTEPIYTLPPMSTGPGTQSAAPLPEPNMPVLHSQSTNVTKSSTTTAFIPPNSSSHSTSLSTSYSSPTPSSFPMTSTSHSPLTYIIVGAVVGGVVILAGLVFVLFRCRRKSAKSEIIPIPYTYNHPSTLGSDTILPCNVSGFKYASNVNSDVAPSHPVVSDGLSSILHSHDTPLSSMDDIVVVARNQAELVEKLYPRARIRSIQRWNEQSVQTGGSTENSDETPPAYSRT